MKSDPLKRLKRWEWPVLDLFAGPGGLGEGFSRLRDRHNRNPFQVRLSIECDESAHQTLELRSFFRQFPRGDAPLDYYKHVRGEMSRDDLFSKWESEAHSAQQEAWHETLGRRGLSGETIDGRIRNALGGRSDWILIGGPPCQAYSIIGRARNRGVAGYSAEQDRRHFLYKEYLRIIARHWPTVFVMENVRGLLSSKVAGQHIFERMIEDLGNPARAIGTRARFKGYVVRPLEVHGEDFDSTTAESYIIRAEAHGVPQTRHRVILIGIRADVARELPALNGAGRVPTVRQVIGNLPRLRAALTGGDSPQAWSRAVTAFANGSGRKKLAGIERRVLREMTDAAANAAIPRAGRGGDFLPWEDVRTDAPGLRRWLSDSRIGGVLNHETRRHIVADLQRYMFVASFGRVHGRSPVLGEFPEALLPMHKSVKKAMNGGYFQDRFRVQVANTPATTITSHIAKDGHYYIHYDPTQCRSLTVREAARLQTFPDNYFFCGGRTSQYRQVGNAVPPFLAIQIARAVYGVIS